ncbi:MAG: hypothetical protein ACT4O3_01860 [Elusimicrobiota bacterium]
MNKSFLLIPILMLPVSASAATKYKAGDIGVGIILGSPTGLSGKYWLGTTTAIDAALGFGDLSLHGDYLWHIADLFPQPKQGKLPAYWGVGARIKDKKDDTEFGIRGVGGMAYWFPRHPVELFLELVPVFEITPDAGLGLDVGLGVRYYFTQR